MLQGLALRDALKGRPVIYEIVPPRRDTSRFQTELRGVEEVLNDSRITAINVPELMNRRELKGGVHYSPATIPPEEYALMVREYKETIVNMVAPRLGRDEFLLRARRIIHDYGVHNLVLVGKERSEDVLPGPGVLEALRLLRGEKGDHVALGGICIFDRESQSSDEYAGEGSRLREHKRVFLKASAGCDFVTSQITFDPAPALRFLSSYQKLCEREGVEPLTVFISLATVPTPGILSVLDRLDVAIPPRVRKRLLASDDMGGESLKVATEVFTGIVERAEREGVGVPLGLQIEQVGVHSDKLSLALLDSTYPILRAP